MGAWGSWPFVMGSLGADRPHFGRVGRVARPIRSADEAIAAGTSSVGARFLAMPPYNRFPGRGQAGKAGSVIAAFERCQSMVVWDERR
jgi:hypothetical protein